jgi:hypothetical protein
VSDASLAVRPRRDEARARALVDAFAREACALAVRLVDAFDRARVRPSARASKSRAQPNTPGSRGFRVSAAAEGTSRCVALPLRARTMRSRWSRAAKIGVAING